MENDASLGVLGLGERGKKRVLGFIGTLARTLPNLSKLGSNIALQLPVHAMD